jgi:chorismate mutase
MEILSERMDIAKQIGQFKKDNNVTILQTNRWAEIVTDRIAKGAKRELTEDFIKELFEAIHQESIRHQTKVMNS